MAHMKYFLIIILASALLGINTSKDVEQASAPPLPSTIELDPTLKSLRDQ